eukprot:Skav205402  [mRNA]  locus=scaffold1642:389501:397166:+ [translate_table: standard]
MGPGKHEVVMALLQQLAAGTAFTSKEIEKALGRISWATTICDPVRVTAAAPRRFISRDPSRCAAVDQTPRCEKTMESMDFQVCGFVSVLLEDAVDSFADEADEALTIDYFADDFQDDHQVEVLASQEVAPGSHVSLAVVQLWLSKFGGKDFERSEMSGRKARKMPDEFQHHFYRTVIHFIG